MIRSQNGVDLTAQHQEKIANFEAMSSRCVGREIVFREAEEAHRGIQSPPILRMSWPEILLLQMNKTSCGLDQTFEVTCIIRGRAQPEMFQDIVRFVITLFIPAAEETDVAWMPGDFLRSSIHRDAADFLNQS